MTGRANVLVLTALLAGCDIGECVAPTHDAVSPTRRPEPVYEELFPAYVEVCATSQYRRLGQDFGGAAGHGVMYVKGLCRDADAPYPQLVPCAEPSNNPKSEQHGAGISVNKMFRSVNWIGTAGKRLFLDGELLPNEKLTQARYDAILHEAVETGMFRGVELHDEYLVDKTSETTMEEFVAKQTLATDYALRVARTIFCARLPLPESALNEIAGFLNELNREYATGEADYNWSGYHDNCVHLIYNALAETGMWPPRSINVIKLRQLFNLAIPANSVVDLGWLASHSPLEDPDEVYADPLIRASLQTSNWIPNRHGALLKSMPIHQDNELFDTGTRLFILNRIFGFSARDKAGTLFADARYTELEANLRFYRSRYEVALGSLPEGSSGDPERAAFRDRYRSYLSDQLAETNAFLDRLTALRNGPS